MELVAPVLFGQVMSRLGDPGVEFQEMMNAFGVTADGPFVVSSSHVRAAAGDICSPSAAVVFEQLVQYALSSFNFELPQPFTYAAPPTQVYEQPQMTYAAPVTYAAPEPVQYFQPQPTMVEQPQYMPQPQQYAPQPTLPTVGSMIAVPQYQFTPQQPAQRPRGDNRPTCQWP